MTAIHASMVGTSFLQNQTIVIAETQSSTRTPLEVRLKRLGAEVYHCTTKKELLSLCDRLNPNLLLLGVLPQTNSLNLCRQCRNFWQYTPIILLANQPAVSNYFRDWAMKQGANNVISSEPENFGQLQAAIKDILFPILEPSRPLGNVIPLEPHLKQQSAHLQENRSKQAKTTTKDSETVQYSYQQAAIALNKISNFSKKYFGNLAVGNYWRKNQNYLQKDYPLLEQWLVDHWGTFDRLEGTPFLAKKTLSEEELESLRTWVLLFIKECERILVDFPQLLHQYAISNIDFQFLL